MESFKGNSIPVQPVQEKKVSPITSDVTVKKEGSLAKKFFAQDLKSTGSNIFNETIIPGAKRILSDIVKRSIDFLLYGSYNATSDGTRFDYRGITTRNISTLSPIGSNQGPQPIQQNYARPSIFSIDEVEFKERGVAEEVLAHLQHVCATYGMVSVADFYDAISQPSNFTDNKYGWKDLTTAQVQRLMNGQYKILFPKVVVLD